MRNFRNYFEEARNMVFKPQAELKPAKYEDIEIFEEGWQEIQSLVKKRLQEIYQT